MSQPDRRLDVRQIEAAPVDNSMTELGAVGTGETLLLQSSFEPEPLYDVLSGHGFTYETEQVDPALYHVRISHAYTVDSGPVRNHPTSRA